jgi:hypothetical protein
MVVAGGPRYLVCRFTDPARFPKWNAAVRSRGEGKNEKGQRDRSAALPFSGSRN